jgi:hypothetical protein
MPSFRSADVHTAVEVRLFSSFPRPPPCHPTCPSSAFNRLRFSALCVTDVSRRARSRETHRARSLARALFHSAARTPQFSPRLAASARLSSPATTWTWCIPTNTTSQLAMLAATWDCHDKACKPRPRSASPSGAALGQLASALQGGSVRQRTSASGALLLSSCGGGGGNTRGAREKAGVRTGARARAQRQLSTRAKRSTSGWFAKHWRHVHPLPFLPRSQYS